MSDLNFKTNCISCNFLIMRKHVVDRGLGVPFLEKEKKTKDSAPLMSELPYTTAWTVSYLKFVRGPRQMCRKPGGSRNSGE